MHVGDPGVEAASARLQQRIRDLDDLPPVDSVSAEPELLGLCPV